jgi:GNAT superfamily N-acetyltransferase
MATTYSVETIEECVTEMGKMWPLHWQEIARDKGDILLDPSVDHYVNFEQQGNLQIVAARHDGVLIGYHVTIVREHLHYKSSLSGYVDLYFIHPDYRRGRIALNMFKYAEEMLRKRGCQRMFTGVPVCKDISNLFNHMGHQETERVHTKFLGV